MIRGKRELIMSDEEAERNTYENQDHESGA